MVNLYHYFLGVNKMVKSSSKVSDNQPALQYTHVSTSFPILLFYFIASRLFLHFNHFTSYSRSAQYH